MVFQKVIGGITAEPTAWRTYIPGGLNTSDGMAKSMTSVNLSSLLAGNTFQIATEETKGQIRRKLPAAKHYIAYLETVQGEGILNQEIRKKTRLNVMWQIAGFSLKQNI